LRATYNQARWIGASWKERFGIFRIPVLGYIASICFWPLIPFLALVKTIKNSKCGFYNSFKFYNCKFAGYGSGVLKAVWRRGASR
jgi:hypothetical protein